MFCWTRSRAYSPRLLLVPGIMRAPTKQMCVFYILLALLLVSGAHSSSSAATTAGAAATPLRKLLVKITPDVDPVTVPFDSSLKIGSDDINKNDPRIVKQAPGCTVPEQVHLTFWSADSVLVSWATCDAVVDITPLQPLSTAGVDSTVQYGKHSNVLNKEATGVATSYAYDYSKAKRPSTYASPLLHHVLLTDLKPGQQYFYRVVGSSDGSSKGNGKSNNGKDSSPSTSEVFNFTMPDTTFPLRIGVMADPGQTYNTSEVLAGMIASQPQMLLLSGDFCYADQWFSADQRRNSTLGDGDITYQGKWDTWSRLFQPLLSHVPFMHTQGNHEIEKQPTGERFISYNHRFPVAQYSRDAPTNFSAMTASTPFVNAFHAEEVPGVFKALFITSYSINQMSGFSPQEEQYMWFEQQLAQTDRSKTPWLIVSFHAPWYNTYAGHFKENECMRERYEQLLVKYEVDLVFSGHVHAYERFEPVVNYKVNESGPVYFTIGDGGNIEGLYKDFIDTVKNTTRFCNETYTKDGKQFPSYQPQQCYGLDDESPYCPDQQPAYSAYREPSFGFGSLDLLNATHAQWTWTKNAMPGWKISDQVTIVRAATGCKGSECGDAPGVKRSARNHRQGLLG